MTRPLVSFVIATYLRADALHAALRAVVLQDDEHWEAIVIGDCCGPETAAAVGAVGDRRIRYYNLPERYGEQGGPNTAGMHLARGDYVAFLNHDDVLLPDHLSRCLSAMRIAGATVFASRFAVTREVQTTLIGPPRPVFGELTPLYRSANQVWRTYETLEPASAWIIAAALARRVGPWRSARSIDRTPLQDWISRVRCAGGRFEFGATVTGVRFLTHTTLPALRYRSPSPVHAAFVDTLSARPVDEIRRQMLDAISRRHAGTDGTDPTSHRSYVRPLAAAVYRWTGFDARPLVRRMRGQRKGDELYASLAMRIGERPPRLPSIASFVADPERWRVP